MADLVGKRRGGTGARFRPLLLLYLRDIVIATSMADGRPIAIWITRST